MAINEKSVATEKSDGADERVMLDYGAIKKAALSLRAINNKQRKDVLRLLNENSRMNVAEIYRKLHWSQPVASVHLSILRRAKLVFAEREIRSMYYSLNAERIAAISEYVNEFTETTK